MRKKKLAIFVSYIIYFNIVFGMFAQAGIFVGGFSSGILTYGVGGGSASIAATAVSQWNGL